MLQINQCEITSDGKHLIVDVMVINASYYSDILIDSIYIETLKTYTATGPNPSKAIAKKINISSKHVRYVADVDSISENLFFVYIVTTGSVSADAPCSQNNPIIVQPVYNKNILYSLGMQYIKDMSRCDVPNNFIDYFLRKEAFLMSLKTGNYTQAIAYWKEFFMNESTSVIHSCGCNGRS